VCSPCPRLYIAVVVVIRRCDSNTSPFTRLLDMPPLDHCDSGHDRKLATELLTYLTRHYCSLHTQRSSELISKDCGLNFNYNDFSTYLHNLISTQRPRSTRSSSVVTLAQPPSSSSLKITDRSFRSASPFLWNQLPLSLRKPHLGTSSSISCSPIPSPTTSSSSDSPLCTSSL